MATEKVEIGFDLVLPTGPFFTLDDAVKGKLDNTTYTLAGFQYYDITNYVTDIQLTRGKSDNIDNISAGDFFVELNNRSRAFDPTYEASPFYGQIIPKRQVRYSVNGIQQAQMVIDDWNLAYSPNGDAIASFSASDGFVYLANQTLAAGTATAQLSGARVISVLDDQYVQWPTDQRDIDPGSSTLGANVVPDGQGVLAYLQQIETTEQGIFFISKTGYATFLDRSHTPQTTNLVILADDGSGIPYQNMQISYGSEDLINEVVSISVVTNTQVTTTNTSSQEEFGIFNQTYSDLLFSTNAQTIEFNNTILAKYAQPVYRFTEVQVRLNDLTSAQQTSILGLELGDFVNVIFTPSNLPPAINKYASVIRLNHSVDISGEHIVTLGLNTLNFTYLILDDLIFGRLDEGALS
jgi:hypothetical protein